MPEESVRRPQPIVYFERIFFATLLLGVLQAYLTWDITTTAVARASPNPHGILHIMGVWFIVTTQAFAYAVTILLILLVSRRRSKIAMWVSIILFACGLPTIARLLAGSTPIGVIPPLSAAITVAQTIGQAVAYGLLFTASARRWMNRQQGPSELEKTFS